jgi:hypothetical protein
MVRDHRSNAANKALPELYPVRATDLALVDTTIFRPRPGRPLETNRLSPDYRLAGEVSLTMSGSRRR